MERFTIQIQSALLPSYWYAGLVGHCFVVKAVTRQFQGHQYRHDFYEVLEGEHKGECFLVSDCVVVNQSFVRKAA